MSYIDKLFRKNEESSPKPQLSGTACARLIPCERILANSAQPRQVFDDDSMIRLADSIRQHGIIQPLTVRCTDDDGIYEIVAGERRYRAARLIGMKSVPCIVIDANDRKSAEIAIVENLQREDLNIFEEAAALASLIEIYSLTQEEAARRMSVSQSYIANKLRLLRLSKPEREKILRHGLSERHARALLRVSEADKRMEIIDYIVANSLTVAATDEYIDSLSRQKPLSSKLSAPKKILLRDIRLFYNSVDRAISTMKAAGIDVTTERIEGEDGTVLTIRIPHDVSRETSDLPSEECFT